MIVLPRLDLEIQSGHFCACNQNREVNNGAHFENAVAQNMIRNALDNIELNSLNHIH